MKLLISVAILMLALFAPGVNAQSTRYDDGWPPDFSERPTSSSPVVLVVPQPFATSQMPPPAPPEPARLVVREYNWPVTGGTGAPFAIVSKDGVVKFAIAVWIQGSILHFTAPSRKSDQLPLSAIDRRATAQLNAEKGLKLPLPGGPGR